MGTNSKCFGRELSVISNLPAPLRLARPGKFVIWNLMEDKNYLTLNNLQVYQLSRQLSKQAWLVYQALDWEMRKIVGSQFIRSVDSIGANIAEGYGRYHYLDKIKFYYNARASHYEAITHWLDLLHERCLIKEDDYAIMIKISSELAPKLNSFINSTYQAKAGGLITNY